MGILGGGIGGQLLALLGLGAPAAAAAAGGAHALDLNAIISSIVGGGVGGGVLMAIIGYIRQAMGKTAMK